MAMLLKKHKTDQLDVRHSTLFGRREELLSLMQQLEPDGKTVSFISGIAGSGKTALTRQFCYEAAKSGVNVIALDCRMIEPTPQGLLTTLSPLVDEDDPLLERLALKVEKIQGITLLCLDHYETFMLADTWVRREFMTVMPDSCRLVIASRRPPVAQWLISPFWQGKTQIMSLGPLQQNEAQELLLSSGVKAEQCDTIISRTHGNPLALELAAAATQLKAPLSEAVALQDVMQELTEVFLSETTEADTRAALETTSVARRITRSLLRALPNVEESQFGKIKELPFVDSWPDGLRLHDAVHEAIHSTLRATDPERYFSTRKAVWKQLCNEMRLTPNSSLWRATADMLFLIENPVVREAFFPSCNHEFAVERAENKDWDHIERIVQKHDGEKGVGAIETWWLHNSDSFHVVRTAEGEVEGFYCMDEARNLNQNILDGDPVSSVWFNHLYESESTDIERILFLRRWLTVEEGEVPSPGQAACWLDVKRAYMELRPGLRKVYLTVKDLSVYAPVATQLGFQHLPECSLQIGESNFHTAMLDFGPQSVDGWITRLVGHEMGINTESPIDKERRSLVINGDEIELTPLEYNVAVHLESKKGHTVTRDELLVEVWGYVDGIGSSNVVDAVVRTLRKKLGPLSGSVETVRGFGYRWCEINE